jgi:four helix bundle protein
VNPQAEELKTRTKQFALDVIRFVGGLPRLPATDVIYRSACRSRSHAEFVARIGIVLEEAGESEFWLELLAESGLPNVVVGPTLLGESRELRAIFAASSLTARRLGHSQAARSDR